MDFQLKAEGNEMIRGIFARKEGELHGDFFFLCFFSRIVRVGDGGCEEGEDVRDDCGGGSEAWVCYPWESRR